MADISKMTKEEIAKYLDYSFVLDPADTEEVYRKYIEEVKKYKFGALCLLPYRIPLVVAEIGDFCKENDIKIGGPVGFPYGQHSTATKVFEALDLVKMGATQLDMATNVAALKEGKYDYYKHELEELAKNFMFTEMERVDESNRCVRFCTSWATREENVNALCDELKKLIQK